MSALKRLLAAALTFVVSACASFAPPPVVGYLKAEGTGQIRANLNALVAFGNIAGEAGFFMSPSLAPVQMEYAVREGEVFLYNWKLGTRETRDIRDPLPAWVRKLFAQGELEQLEQELGFPLKFEE